MVEVMRRRIGADTLRFQRLEDLVRAIGLPKDCLLYTSILADIPSMSENRKRLSRKIPVMPAILLQTPMILMRCAALSIGPRIVTYGFEAVCNSASPVPCRNSPSRNSA